MEIDGTHAADVQFSAREVPWMKLGKLTDESLTAAEAAKLGGIDFTVSTRKIKFETLPTHGQTDWVTISDRVAVVRNDTGQPLSIVSDGYKILQYVEAFDFLDSVVNGVDTRYVAAGSLRGGRQGFMVVRAPDSMQPKLKVDDPHELFIVIRTSHDRTRGCEITAMPLRGRCMNQLTLGSFSKGAANRWSVHHTSTMDAKLAEAKAAVANLAAYSTRFAEIVDKLAVAKLSEEQARKILERVEPVRPKTSDKIDTILHLWNEAETVGFSGTAWGLVNAISEYYDWGRSGGTPESRFLGALEGQSTKAINRATGIILSRV